MLFKTGAVVLLLIFSILVLLEPSLLYAKPLQKFKNTEYSCAVQSCPTRPGDPPCNPGTQCGPTGACEPICPDGSTVARWPRCCMYGEHDTNYKISYKNCKSCDEETFNLLKPIRVYGEIGIPRAKLSLYNLLIHGLEDKEKIEQLKSCIDEPLVCLLGICDHRDQNDPNDKRCRKECDTTILLNNLEECVIPTNNLTNGGFWIFE